MQRNENEKNGSYPTPNPTSDFNWRQTKTGGVAITKFRCQNASSCVVPAEIDGKAVVEIASNAFIGDSLNSLTLPAGIQTVGINANRRDKRFFQVQRVAIGYAPRLRVARRLESGARLVYPPNADARSSFARRRRRSFHSRR